MTEPSQSAAAGTALVICKDAQARQLIIESLQPLAIRPEMCEESFAAADLLDKQKFEAIIVDLLLGEEARLIMEHLRFSRANRTAVTFAITTGEWTSGVKQDAKKPLSAASVNQTLRAAYGLIVRERRRYFRCPVVIPVYVDVRGAEELLCQTVNISEGGMAIRCPTVLGSNLPARVRLSLPDHSSQLFGDTQVCWSSEDGLVGLGFQCLASPQRSELEEWLARKLDETLPEDVAALFRSVGQIPP